MRTTKEKILEVALELFNEKGCLNTSTRHIAQKLGISVGNLYYHFKNKESILIEIFNEYIEVVFKEMKELNYEKDEIFLLKQFLADSIEADIKYRFLHLELNLLVMNFPAFKKIMEEHLHFEIETIKGLIRHQIKYGYITPMSELELDVFVSNSWIIATQNASYWNLLSENFIENSKKTALNIYFLVKPYLTQKSFENEDIKDIEKFLGSII